MKRTIILALFAVFVFGTATPEISFAGGTPLHYAAPVDPVLTGFKEQGVWYFLCTAPVYQYRVPPHYTSYAPLPQPCPVPVGPPVPARGLR